MPHNVAFAAGARAMLSMHDASPEGGRLGSLDEKRAGPGPALSSAFISDAAAFSTQLDQLGSAEQACRRLLGILCA